MSAFRRELGQVLAQVSIQNKEAELTVAPDLLGRVDWQGRVLTGDAIFCQRNLCSTVVAGGGDYVFVVKGNQGSLQAGIAQLFELPTQAELYKPSGFSSPGAARNKWG